MAEEPFLIKDFFNRLSVGSVASAVGAVYPKFDLDGFMAAVFDRRWKSRELKERMRHITVTLHDFLPTPYAEALGVLRKASPATEGFAAMVFSDFVEAYGVTEDIEISLPALVDFTKIVSAEFAVRPFLVQDQERMLAEMVKWTKSDDWRVRRLASEGSRPRLPWGIGLKSFQKDPSPILPILTALRHDPSEDVRRSVANSLNDISKDHPELVVEVLAEWEDGSDEIAGIAKHGLRTLLKRGDPSALELLGYRTGADVSVHDLVVAPDPALVGSKVTVEFVARNDGASAEHVMIDGVVGFHRPRGISTKVFKWKTVLLEPSESITIKRSVTLQQLSTRTIYPGAHTVEVQINGTRSAFSTFEVIAE